METALRGTKKEGAKKTRSMPQSPELIKGKNDRGWRKKWTLAPFFCPLGQRGIEGEKGEGCKPPFFHRD